MSEHFALYGLFLAKTTTTVVAVLIIFAGITALAAKNKLKEKLEIKKLNDKYSDTQLTLQKATLEKSDFKKLQKVAQKAKKQKAELLADKPSLFVLNFNGDMRASEVANLREIITAILMVATPEDEVLVKLESPGGMVHSYGLAASQLARIRSHNIPLTVAVDKVAASGGYMMACVANKILAAPFAIIGSIGVVFQLANFHRLLKKHDVDFEQFTAGEYKRTVTAFGENTAKGREKLQQELEDTHELFKSFITENRPQVDMANIATGEYWYGSRAKELQLVDELITSDDYLLQANNEINVYEITYTMKKSWTEKLGFNLQQAIGKFFTGYKAII